MQKENKLAVQQEEDGYFVTNSAGQQVNVCFETLIGNEGESEMSEEKEKR